MKLLLCEVISPQIKSHISVSTAGFLLEPFPNISSELVSELQEKLMKKMVCIVYVVFSPVYIFLFITKMIYKYKSLHLLYFSMSIQHCLLNEH